MVKTTAILREIFGDQNFKASEHKDVLAFLDESWNINVSDHNRSYVLNFAPNQTHWIRS